MMGCGCREAQKILQQSAAIRSALLASRGSLIGVLDGDGQNVPADFPALEAALVAQCPADGHTVGMAAGIRAKRKDNQARLLASPGCTQWQRVRSRMGEEGSTPGWADQEDRAQPEPGKLAARVVGCQWSPQGEVWALVTMSAGCVCVGDPGPVGEHHTIVRGG